jgi:branched-chain amino acid transport system permease protein
VALERISRSPWGRVQRAVRDEENSAAMSGKPVTFFRIESFVVGSFIMGVGGAIYAHYVVSIDYSHFNPLFATFIVWVMLMLGGSGNNKGAILGAFVVWAVWTGTQSLVDLIAPALSIISPDLPSRSAYFRWMLVAILLAAIVLYRPEGIIRERKRVSDFMKWTGKD